MRKPMIAERTLHALEYGKVLEQLAHFCASPSGKEAARALRPLESAADAGEAALLYEESCVWHANPLPDGGTFHLSSFPDVTGVQRFVQSPSAILETDALWTLREVLRLASAARASITVPLGETRWPRLLAVVGRCAHPAETAAALQRCLNDDGLLRDESSPGLLLVRGELRSLHLNCMRKVKDFAKQYNILHYLQDEFMTLASDRYVLPLKANFKGRLQGIIHDWSQTGETCYFEPMFLVEINNRLQELKHQEREEERKVLEYLTGLVRTQWPDILGATQMLTGLDVLLAKQKLADAMHGAHCATLSDTGGVRLVNARHPLLALASQAHPAHPVDLLLPKEKRGLIISGGNAGGKTVCLKTLGLMALMTLTGLPVPADKGATLPAWTRVHAFIGDEQSLDDQVSTFTAQIQHLADAWQHADAHSLIILDEFGAGTDPTQGAALAQAVLDSLLERDVCVVAATHFPALKAYALAHAKTRAASVLFDPGTKRPLFRLAYDQVGASQALDVAREHGMPEEIIRRAEQYLLMDGGEGGQDSGSVIARLNALAVEREKGLADLKREQERFAAKRAQLQERFGEERRKLHDEVRARAQELMAAWKAGKATHKQALKDMSRLRASLVQHASGMAGDATPPAPSVPVETLRVGDEVLHRPFGKTGRVMDIDTRRQRVRVDLNGVTLWAAMKDIAPKNAPDAATGAPVAAAGGRGGTVTVKVAPQQGSLLRLDLRGKRADMALSEVEQFLDKALLDGREEVEIIHGRGTGVLRRQVHEYLRTCPSVAQAVLAPEDRGGDGMTIVTLR